MTLAQRENIGQWRLDSTDVLRTCPFVTNGSHSGAMPCWADVVIQEIVTVSRTFD